MTRVFNRRSEKEKRHRLRKNMTEAEILVWSKLCAKQMQGYKFRRQYSVGVHVVDFYCPSLKLAIEIDGDTHFQAGAGEYDRTRQEFIERLGIRFLRFTNAEVCGNLQEVLECIRQTVEEMRKSVA